MTNKQINRQLLPIIGIFLFVLLYIIAAFFYPGGSNHQVNSVGFSWVHNYWCDLMGSLAKNHEYNPAYPVAIFAWIILCLSILLFWNNFPLLFEIKNKRQNIIRCLGIIASFLAIFLFTNYHDAVINLSGFMISIVLLLAFFELKRAQQWGILGFMIACFVLSTINYFIYTTSFFIDHLAWVQKFTFIVCLLFFTSIQLKVYQKLKKKHKKLEVS